MRANPAKAALKAGKTLIGCGMGLAAGPVGIRLLANAGYDFVFIDCEHNQMDQRQLLDTVQTARLAGISPIVRPRDTEYDLIAGTLDTGADGLIVPRVESREQAERLVSYCKFPPQGVRGCGTNAMLDYQTPDWPKALPWLNEQVLLCPQVESMKAVEALDDIAKVPGIDVIVIGPLDLSISLGVPAQFDHPKMVATIDRIISICKANNVYCGLVMGPPPALKPWWEKGIRFFSSMSDIGFIISGANANVAAMRAATSV